MFWATYRGSNVHSTIEKCKDKKEFKDWIFEKRFFAIINPDDTIDKFNGPSNSPDWLEIENFQKKCRELTASGHIILSGQIDSFDTKNEIVHDWKTSKAVDEKTSVKQSWQQQMNQYSLLLFLHGMPVRRIRITVMDATMPVVLEVPVPDLESWAGMYLVPRARYLAKLAKIPVEEIQAVADGGIPPAHFPAPKPNHLCNGKNEEGKIYCPFREDGKCPAWREPDLTALLEESLRRIDSKSKKKMRKSDAEAGPEPNNGGQDTWWI